MAEELLALANFGAEVVRFDALAFTWKKLGTTCQNLPEAHLLIQTFNTVARIVAPAVLFKSEAIVHPDEVNKYIGEHECQLSYNPGLMALLWNALATREVRLLRHAMRKRFSIPAECSWVNYIRCHDDIGWTFSDDDTRELGMNPADHRRFLSQFFTGRFPNSFAKGLPFQENFKTGDCRVSGTTASLCGLEKAVEENNEHEIDLAIRRILLLHGVILTIGGIPLIYLGDELGVCNDYSYTEDPEKDGDSRWLHRPSFDWERAEQSSDMESIPGRIFQGLLRLTQIRQRTLAFARTDTNIVDVGNDHVFAYFRHYDGQAVLVLANFTEHHQSVVGSQLRLQGLRKTTADLVSGIAITAAQELVLEPYQFMVLVTLN
jgi:amylosucrase/maltose alpha-D-glucosyltransferase/alpha-amylase